MKNIQKKPAIYIGAIVCSAIVFCAAIIYTNIADNTFLNIKTIFFNSFGFGWIIILIYSILIYISIKHSYKIILQYKYFFAWSLLVLFVIICSLALWYIPQISEHSLSGKWGYQIISNNIITIILVYIILITYTYLIFKNLNNIPNIIKNHILYNKIIRYDDQPETLKQQNDSGDSKNNDSSYQTNNNRQSNSNGPSNNYINQETKKNNWNLPDYTILSDYTIEKMGQTAIDNIANIIKQSFSEHNININIVNSYSSARILRFGIEPGYNTIKHNRIKVTDITKRQKDLALALKTPYVRIIENPKPSEGLVGIEIPHLFPNNVSLKSIINNDAYQDILNNDGLPLAIGEDTSGEPIILNLSDLPHLLIAGTTGSGKSVCIDSLLMSLLIAKTPNDIELFLIDPKHVELTRFNNFPHLGHPIITDVKDVNNILQRIIDQMRQRYLLIQSMQVRNIKEYNQCNADILPYIIIVIDELEDLLISAPGIESQLVKIAQLGRASGIHLILATQRPVVKVITGQMKANIPARIAFKVASQTDSRVIIDSNGAEKLTGDGDLLITANDTLGIRRGQGILVQNQEIQNLEQFWDQ